ncbi:cell division protein FtsZ [Candidatus Phycorickettsia trachydisci]|uniref:Cell division protein FtsZ n=1 Tax=Candidatus Phycorickettsia trachydisci TaxID=2115978 RepID=A0A2P1P8U0_9RICK|nr:cell division protein FtsZ [Candidatus Phycorickettsia trachydisci]
MSVINQENLKPKIVVFGVGGAGGNAVNNMISSNLQGVTYVVANTDAQALENALADNKIQLGINTTQGLGAGAKPEVGEAAAEESLHEIRDYLNGANLVFITAGMGGGTGTGAAPVVAKIAKEMKILTVGVVTKPFSFEGSHRMKVADSGLEKLAASVDTLIIIANQNLFLIANENTTFMEAFKIADNVLRDGVCGIVELIIVDGLINLDLADISTIMKNGGPAMMGTGSASRDEEAEMGEKRAIIAASRAIANPLLDRITISGASKVLINITGGMDMTLMEVDAAANRIREEINNPSANIIFGSTFRQELEGKIVVSVFATGLQNAPQTVSRPKMQEETRAVIQDEHVNIQEGQNIIRPKKEIDASYDDQDTEVPAFLRNFLYKRAAVKEQ